MKRATRNSLRLVETLLEGSTTSPYRPSSSRLFATSNHTGKERSIQGSSKRSPPRIPRDKTQTRPREAAIAWTTAATSQSEEARAFIANDEADYKEGVELFEELEEPTSHNAGLSRVTKGCIVECRRSETSFIGVVLATTIAANRIRYMVMDASGQVIPSSEADVQFIFRNTVQNPTAKGKERQTLNFDFHPQMIEDAFSLEINIATEGLSDGEIAALQAQAKHREETRRRIARQLRTILLATERRTGALIRDPNGSFQPEHLWEQCLASNDNHSNDSIWPVLTSQDILARYPSIPKDEITRFALHSILLSRPDLFQADEADLKSSGKFSVRPKWMVEDLEKAVRALKSWESGPDGRDTESAWPITQFVDECKQVVMETRTTGSPPNTEQRARLGEGSKLLLRILRQNLLEQRGIQHSPYKVFPPVLLGLTGLYDRQVLDVSTTSLFMYEMGELGESGSTGLMRLEDLEQKEGSLELVNPAQVTGRSAQDSTTRQDPHESTRHDFGKLPVYVIDSVDAHELDDGVSIENVAGTTDKWIHIHIADPTRWITPDDDMASIIMRRGQTFYAPHTGRAMIPGDLVMSKMSLGAMYEKGLGQAVLSFSAKVNDKGELVDYKVRSGVANNIKVITYEHVDNVLASREATDERTARDVAALNSIAAAMRHRRLRDSGLEWQIPQASVETNQVRGQINTQWQVSTNERSPSRMLVAECMIMAGQVAGRFGMERGLHLPYRGSTSPFIPTRSLPPGWTSERFLQDLLDKRDPATLESSFTDIAKSNIFIKGSPSSTVPVDHWILGIKAAQGGYSRVTSPLRRFADMLGHWQIKHALLPGAGKPLFDRTRMEGLNEYTNKVDKRIKRLDQQSQAYWRALAIQRALSQGGMMPDGQSLHDLEGIVMSSPEYSTARRSLRTQLYVPSLALKVQLDQANVSVAEREQSWEIGEKRKIRISETVLWPTAFVNAALIG